MNTPNAILSDLTVHSKYAKHLPLLERRETWRELGTRNKHMHMRKYLGLIDEIEQVYTDFVFTKKVLPSMRSLQFGGKPIEVANNRIYNCAYLPAERVSAFRETMFLLLGGSGVGYSVQYRHVNQLPPLKGHSLTQPAMRYRIGDSIEGWADAVAALMRAYFYGKPLPVFDYSDIRPKGSPIKTTGGKAPGPDPLRKCLTLIQEKLDTIICERGRGTQLKPIEVHDILCYIADSVLSGGIRRSAMISLFSIDDTEMLNAKGNFECTLEAVVAQLDDDAILADITARGKVYHSVYLDVAAQTQYAETGVLPWWHFEPQRGRANNSVTLLRGTVTEAEFKAIWDAIKASGAGEPGVYWTNNLDWGTNPCCEIALPPYTFCNLVEVNAATIVNQADYEARARAATFIATLQAGYTNFHYLNADLKVATEEHALIGVGQTGIASGSVVNLDHAAAAAVVLEENTRVAALIGINPAARTTTVKPAGTTSLVLGCSSGIHAWHAPYYLRRMRLAKNEPIYQYLAKHHPELVVDDAFDPTNTAVVEVPQKAPEDAILRSESALDMLNRVYLYNTEWVRKGFRYGDNHNNVSCTISLREHEWDEVGKWMWDNRDFYNGISVLPYDGGSYVQAPFEDITQDEYERRLAFLTELDVSKIVEIDSSYDVSAELACSAGGCDVAAL